VLFIDLLDTDLVFLDPLGQFLDGKLREFLLAGTVLDFLGTLGGLRCLRCLRCLGQQRIKALLDASKLLGDAGSHGN
jgi:hypothetical protein